MKYSTGEHEDDSGARGGEARSSLSKELNLAPLASTRPHNTVDTQLIHSHNTQLNVLNTQLNTLIYYFVLY